MAFVLLDSWTAIRPASLPPLAPMLLVPRRIRPVGRGRGDGPLITLDRVVAGTMIAAVEVYDRPSLSPGEYAPRGDCG